ncbi:glycoside hydrolase family 25 protein [Sphingomonas sp. ac-8]|uniref:glycoside hydrolase family 25 protein n=1 Tax=Sphingomonas sp. ac-8 TaxID=3242977 RepID=UPI003A80CF38
MRVVRAMLVIAAASSLAGAAAWNYAVGWHPSTGEYPIQGIDVSQETGPVDWLTARARGVDFAYVRAIRDGTRRDRRFQSNWAALGEAGMRRGVLHQFSLCRPAESQADAFVTFVPRAIDALPAVLELDLDAGCAARPDRAAVLAAIRSFLAVVEHHTGSPMLLKISEPFEQAYPVSGAIARPLWASQDFFAPLYLARPWRMWQASTIRRIDGVDRPVHWDVVAP